MLASHSYDSQQQLVEAIERKHKKVYGVSFS